MSDVETFPAPRAHESMATVVVRSPGRTPLRLVIGEPVVIGRECVIDDALMSRRTLEPADVEALVTPIAASAARNQVELLVPAQPTDVQRGLQLDIGL